MRFFKFSAGVVALCVLCISGVYAQKNDPVINKVIEIANEVVILVGERNKKCRLLK